MLHSSSELAGPFEHYNETLVSITGGKVLEQLSDYQLVKKDSVP